ncbi:MAG: hypothetical protein HRT72_05015 [Flavobacteriales bacterium]|nr:hypothetical protein [Flavobacteriales bacterium]
MKGGKSQPCFGFITKEFILKPNTQLRFLFIFFHITIALSGCGGFEVEHVPVDQSQFETLKILLGDSIRVSLNNLRKVALDKNDFTKSKTWFPGILINNGDTLLGKVRLKGDQHDHYNTNQFSLRIKMKRDSNKTIVFSLQHPKCRRYISEWLFQQLLKEAKLPSLNYRFVFFGINEDTVKLFASEEHFSNIDILGRWNKADGPIIGFDDKDYWPKGIGNKDRSFDTEVYLDSEIKCYNCSKKEKKGDAFAKAKSLLDDYREGVLKVNEVFNVDLLAKFYAICDLAGASHSLRWLNCRFYYNPSTQLLEPVGFDSNCRGINTISIKSDGLNNSHHGRIFHNMEFQQSYYKYIDRFARTDFLDRFLGKHKERVNIMISTINKEFNNDSSSKITLLYKNQWIMRWHSFLNILQ